MHDDAALLRRYAEERSEEAFAELVRRHLGLVYFAALRRTGGDVPTAEDVAQQVFTALARDAAALWHHAVLTGWLYTTTRNLALKTMRTEHRRQIREQEAHAMQALTSGSAPDADWRRLQPVLDGALDELNDADRTAVLLRYFDNRPFADIGAALRLSEDAARMRVDRALDKLRALLAKRGIDSTAAALATVLANQAAATAPAGLAASVTGAALSGAAAAEAGVVAAAIAFMTATKTTVTLGVAAALALTTAVYQSSEARTIAAVLAAEQQACAAARARLAELEAKARAAEQALADRENAAAQAAATVAAMASRVTAPSLPVDEAAQQQKALQQFLDNDPQLRTLKAEAAKVSVKAEHWPIFHAMGLTPAQADRACALRLESGPKTGYARFRTVFGDAVAERLIEYDRIRGKEGDKARQLFTALYYTDEPFTAQQTKRMLEIIGNARQKRSATWYFWGQGCDWDRVLAEAASVLSPAQLQGVRAVAAQTRAGEVFSAANKEAPSVAKP